MSNLWLFVQAHWLGLLTGWMILNGVLSKVADSVPPTSALAKALHVWVAINPMDIMKAIKAIGAEVVPPAGGAAMGVFFVMCLAFGTGVSVSACSSTPQAQTVSVDPRALADASTALLETAWKDAAQACLDAANAQHDDTIRQKCEPPLTKARAGLLAAQAAIDVWGAAEQANYPCLVSQVVLAFGEVAQLGSFKAPQSLVDAENIAQAYVGKCTSIAPAAADAGKGS